MQIKQIFYKELILAYLWVGLTYYWILFLELLDNHGHLRITGTGI